MQSPQMIQAMQILQLSSLDLQERISEELVENPFLEVDEGGGEGGEDKSDGDADRAADDAFESMVETLERYESDFGDGRSRVPAPQDVDKKLEAMNNTPASYHSLGDAVVEQIAFSDLSDGRRRIAEYIAYSLDDRGYLEDDLETIAAESGVEGIDEDDVRSVLNELRASTHPALGAHDLRECLLLQVDAGALGDLESSLVRTLITDHLENITANRLPRIARATGHSLEDIKHGIEAMRTLDPLPRS